MARATISLPVPLSPVNRIVALLSRTESTACNTLRNAGLSPTRLSNCACSSSSSAHAGVVAHDVAKLQGLGHGDVQLVDIERLGNVVIRTVAHRLYGVFHRAVGGHHDHRHLGIARLDLGQQRRTVHARHAPVADHQVDVFLLQHFERVQAVTRREHLDAILAEGRRQQVTELGLVVDHQYVMRHECPRRLRRLPECTG